jgi:hypothetical protein
LCERDCVLVVNELPYFSASVSNCIGSKRCVFLQQYISAIDEHFQQFDIVVTFKMRCDLAVLAASDLMHDALRIDDHLTGHVLTIASQNAAVCLPGLKAVVGVGSVDHQDFLSLAKVDRSSVQLEEISARDFDVT